MDSRVGPTPASAVPIERSPMPLLKSTMVGSFLWRVDENAVFSYGDEHTPTFFTIDAQSWEDMGKPERITILVTPGDALNES